MCLKLKKHEKYLISNERLLISTMFESVTPVWVTISEIFVASITGGGGRGGLPYLGYTGTCRWTEYGFWPRSPFKTGYTTIWLAPVLNRVRTCPKLGMVLRTQRTGPSQSIPFRSLREVTLNKHSIDGRTTRGVFFFLICIIPAANRTCVTECYCCRYPLI